MRSLTPDALDPKTESRYFDWISFSLAGITYRPEYQRDQRAYLQRFKPQATFALVPEPTNEHDRNAVTVVDLAEPNHTCLGYVPAVIAPQVASFLEHGYKMRAKVVLVEAKQNRPPTILMCVQLPDLRS